MKEDALYLYMAQKTACPWISTTLGEADPGFLGEGASNAVEKSKCKK